MCRCFNKNNCYFSFLFVFYVYILLFASLTEIQSSAQSVTLVSFWLKVGFFFHIFSVQKWPRNCEGAGWPLDGEVQVTFIFMMCGLRGGGGGG